MIAKYGEKAFFEALKIGQGDRDKGIAYFGKERAWSSNILDDILKDHVGKNLQKVVFIDLHTAVGEYAHWTPMCPDKNTYRILSKWMKDIDIDIHMSDVKGINNEPLYEFIKEKTGAEEIVRFSPEAGTYK